MRDAVAGTSSDTARSIVWPKRFFVGVHVGVSQVDFGFKCDTLNVTD